MAWTKAMECFILLNVKQNLHSKICRLSICECSRYRTQTCSMKGTVHTSVLPWLSVIQFTGAAADPAAVFLQGRPNFSGSENGLPVHT